MSDARSANPAPATSPESPSTPSVHLAQTVRVRQGSESNPCLASPRPSPYMPRVQPASSRSFPESSAGIGGPPKRRESMSGIGNNLRSNNPAVLGRGVGRFKNASPDHGPSGISDFLRRRNSCATSAPPPANSTSLPARNLRRRGSVNTAAPVTADTLTHYSTSTIFPMSHTALADTHSPQRPLRRRTTLAIHRHTEAAILPVDRSACPQSQPLSPAYIYPASPLSLPSARPRLHLPSTENQPTIAQVAFSPQVLNADTGGNAQADRRRSSSNSPVETGMTVGSPRSGKVVDVVGSFTNPSIVYAPVRKNSKIGGAEKGKATMQHSHGIGGSFGKDWMADRPSGIGAAVAHDAHPESGISKALKTLGIKKNK